MFKYPASTAPVQHYPKPTTLISLDNRTHQTEMSSSPGLLTCSKLEPPPNLTNLDYDEDEVVEYPQLILLGDSITQYSTLTFQAYLQTLYIRRLDVINRGFSGFTAPMGLKVLQKLLPCSGTQPARPNIKLLTVLFGANDACMPGEAQHVELRKYISALKRITQYPALRSSADKAEVIVITPPPVNEHQFSKLPSDCYQRRAGTTSQYAKAVLELEALRDVHVLDFWSAMMRKVGWRDDMGRDCCCEHLSGTLSARRTVTHIPGCCNCPTRMPDVDYELADFLCDGLHLTKLGYDLLFSELMCLIRREIPQYAPENLSFVFPEWRAALSWDGSTANP